MQMPFGWALPSRTSLLTMCACYALCGAPAAALAAPEQIAPTPVESTPAPAAPISTANNSTVRTGSPVFNRRVLALVGIGCLVGMIVGWVVHSPPETRFRLLNKPKKMPPPVLVPPTRAPRLVPGDSPKATRARSIHTPMPRPTPVGPTRPGVIHYLAVFSDSGKASGGTRVDYLLESSNGTEESPDPSGEFVGPTRDAP